MAEKTFWNYEPAPARVVRVIVGKSKQPTWWCASLEGTEREAVEVTYHGSVFYLDNEGGEISHMGGASWPAGEGWAKVTKGRGGPDWPHSELPVARVLPAILPGLPGGPPYVPTAPASGIVAASSGRDAQRLDERSEQSPTGEAGDARGESS
jgi:hypothetical protein